MSKTEMDEIIDLIRKQMLHHLGVAEQLNHGLSDLRRPGSRRSDPKEEVDEKERKKVDGNEIERYTC
jgi:hypothetical protein